MTQPQRHQQQRPELVPVELNIPEELLVWASTPEVEVTLSRPMAEEVRVLVEIGDAEGCLEHADTEKLFARLDGLVTAALAANRGDLLLNFDTFTADWLGLSFGVDTALGRLEVGHHAAWTFGELNRAHAAGPEGAAVTWAMKALCCDVFPGARAVATSELSDHPCASCGEVDFSVMMLTESGGQYCRSCWTTMTTRPLNGAELKAQDRARVKR